MIHSMCITNAKTFLELNNILIGSFSGSLVEVTDIQVPILQALLPGVLQHLKIIPLLLRYNLSLQLANKVSLNSFLLIRMVSLLTMSSWVHTMEPMTCNSSLKLVNLSQIVAHLVLLPYKWSKRQICYKILIWSHNGNVNWEVSDRNNTFCWFKAYNSDQKSPMNHSASDRSEYINSVKNMPKPIFLSTYINND